MPTNFHGKSSQLRGDHMVKFGTTDLYVSRVCQGTAFRNMLQSDHSDMRLRVLEHCLDVGLNFFDSSNGYGMGEAERVLGKAIAGRRERAVVCTKLVRHDVPDGADANDTFEPAQYTRDLIFSNTDRCLKRLGTDYIDIVLLHHRDGLGDRFTPQQSERFMLRYGNGSETPPEEIVDTMDALVQTGKVRYWGVSSRNASEVNRFLEVCELNGKEPLACLQNGYNLIGRYRDTEGLFPLLRRTGIGVQTIGPHAGGGLVKLTESHAELGAVLEKVSGDMGVSRSQVCVAWVLSHPELTTALAGAVDLAQVEDNLAGSMIEIPPEAIVALNAASERYHIP